ncbi:MAG: hypothetical protein MK101_12690 [Phycisphaerales bacterium]|nr:hypothetical protein [Phycisphaerales bacterium]
MNPMLVEQLVTCSVGLLAGVVLWSMGVKILRPALGLAGLFIGAVLGWLAWTQVGEAAPMWTLMLGVGIVVACVSMLVYRLVLASLLATFLSIFFMVAAWSSLATVDAGGPPPPPLVDLGALVVGSASVDGAVLDHAPADNNDALLPAASLHVQSAQRVLKERAGILQQSWSELKPGTRLIVLGCLLAGLLLGLIIATFALRASAILATSILGSLLILGSLARLVTLSGAPAHALQDTWVLLPLVCWAALAGVGIAAQAVFIPRKQAADEKPT